MIQALNTAAAAMTAASNRLDASARRTSASPADNTEVEIVEQISAVQDFKANAAVARAADEMTGSLLDTLA